MTKVNILSSNRFHLLDLARELSSNGFDVKFYSFVPNRRAVMYGLSHQCSKSLVILLAPFLVLARVLFKRKLWAENLLMLVQDFLTARLMRKSDVCIALSGRYVYALRKARRDGAYVIVERGSMHVVEQARILDSISSCRIRPISFHIQRELASYALADKISIPAQHVQESFLRQGFKQDQLLVNPYGVNLQMFCIEPQATKQYDVLMVGNWSYRKGCDLINSVLESSNLTFLHVGSIGDLSIPEHPRFTHVDSVDESKLVKYYNRAKIFVLPSREEGFGMVLIQAVACNLPIVAGKNTGGNDLKKMVDQPQYITIMDECSPQCLSRSIDKAMSDYKHLNPNEPYAGKGIENISWAAYGRRYAHNIRELLK